MTDPGDTTLDLVCLGRINVDLYAEQDGAPLEDVQSFRKYVGGSAANICIGTARLGPKSAMVGRVGDEQLVRGFAVGRGIFAEPARRWFKGEIPDAELVDTVSENYAQFIAIWHNRKETP